MFVTCLVDSTRQRRAEMAGGGGGDFVFAEFEDDVDVIFVFETFLVADNIGMLERLMDFYFSN